jgi:hypothetical protein
MPLPAQCANCSRLFLAWSADESDQGRLSLGEQSERQPWKPMTSGGVTGDEMGKWLVSGCHAIVGSRGQTLALLRILAFFPERSALETFEPWTETRDERPEQNKHGQQHGENFGTAPPTIWAHEVGAAAWTSLLLFERDGFGSRRNPFLRLECVELRQ